MFQSKPLIFTRPRSAQQTRSLPGRRDSSADSQRLPRRRAASGKVRQGLEEQDRPNWIREGQSDYLEKAPADVLRLTDHGRNLNRCLAVSFTWDENHRFTASIRKALKGRGVLLVEGTRLEVHGRFAGPISGSETGNATNQDKS
jgi:hypothetical protein